MDIKELRIKILEKTRTFNIFPKKKCAFILFEFNKQFKTKRYQKTDYIFLKCRVLMKDDEKIPFGKHTIQLPMKTAWIQLYEYLEDNNLVDKKNICLKYEKINQYHYCWSIANKKDYTITPLSYYNLLGNDSRNLLRKDIGNVSGNLSGNLLRNDIRNLSDKNDEDKEDIPEEDIEEF